MARHSLSKYGDTYPVFSIISPTPQHNIFGNGTRLSLRRYDEKIIEHKLNSLLDKQNAISCSAENGATDCVYQIHSQST